MFNSNDQMQVHALFEHATEGMILTDDRGRIVLLNPAAARLFEYHIEELLGQSIETLIPARFHGGHTHYREGFYQHPGNRTMGHGRDLFARKKDGKEFPVEVSLSHYRQGDTFYVIAFIVDITQRKQSEKELLDRKEQLEKITKDISRLNAELETKVEQRTLILREALQELERSQSELNEALNKEKELNEIKSRFVSMASHEFRTPLSTVLSSAALLARYTQTEEQDKRDKHIKRIKDSVKHLNTLLEDFLSLGKLEEGHVRVDPQTFSLKEFLEDIIDEMRSITKEGQEIHCELKEDITITSDRHLLKNILINLLGNAVKFSLENSSIWLTITHPNSIASHPNSITSHPNTNASHPNSSALNPAPNKIALAVRDEGIGISAEDQQHLFSSFYRGANATNIEGTGLGLHIVKRYADLLKGDIRLTSTLGKGTTVTLQLPATLHESSPQ